MNRLVPALFLTLLGTAVLCVFEPKPAGSPAAGSRSLFVYCAAGLKNPVEAIAAQYRAETGVEVQLQYGGTATLLSTIRTSKRGDVFLAADSLGITEGRTYKLVVESVPLIRQHPVLAVSKGNPKRLHSLADLQIEGVRLALANPEAAAIGRVTRSVLGAAYDPLAKKAIVTKPTVSDIAADLSLGAVDAAIVWDSTVAQFPKLEAVQIPPLSDHSEEASVAVLSTSQSHSEASRFAHFLAAPEKGGVIFKRMGFVPGSENP